MPTLADIIGGIESVLLPQKRRFANALRDPMGDIQQTLGLLDDKAKQFTNALKTSQEGGELAQMNSVMAGLPQYRQASDYVTNALTNQVMSFAPIGAIDKVSLAAKYPNVDFQLNQSGNKATLGKIVIPKAEREQGIGSAFMRDLIAAADADAAQLALSPASDFGGNKARLIEFYKRFGFVPNKGRNKDFTVSETMLRDPQQ